MADDPNNEGAEERLSFEQELIQLLQKRQGIEEKILDDNRDLANVLADQVKQTKFQNVEKNKIRSLNREIVKISDELYSNTEDELGTQKNISDILEKRQRLDKISIQLSSLVNKIKLEDKELEDEINRNLKERIEQARQLEREAKKLQETSEKIANNFGVKTFGALSDITKAIPGLKRFSTPFQEASEASRKQVILNEKLQGVNFKTGKGLTAEKIRQLGLEKELLDKNGKILTGNAAASKIRAQGLDKNLKSMSSLKAGALSLGKSLTAALGPAMIIGTIIAQLVKAFKAVDEQAGKLAKDMGISYKEASNLNSEFRSMSVNYGEASVHGEDIRNAQSQMNQTLGTSVVFSEKMAGDFAHVKKNLELSDEAMAFFQKNSLKTGKSIKETLADVNGITYQLNDQTGLQLNSKQLMESIAKTSKATQLTYKGNVKELGKAVYQAKKLGLELSDVEKISDHILDFESSIQSELEAELLLGKEINLEKARAFALQGKTGEVAKEVMKNQAIMNAFETDNVIAQEAAAKAIGMNRDELAGMIKEQQALEAVRAAGYKDMNEAQKAYTEYRQQGLSIEEAANAAGMKGLEDQLESESAAQRMENIMTKIQEIFLNIAENILPLIAPILEFISSVIGTIGEGISLMIDGFKAVMPVLLPIVGIIGVLFAKTIALAAVSIVKGAWTALGAIPFVGPVLATAAALAGIGALYRLSKPKKIEDGIINPRGGLLVQGEKGSIQLDKDDSIIAGTSLLGNKKQQPLRNPTPPPPPPPQSDPKMIALLTQIAEKQTVIEMNGNKVGEGIATSDRRIQ